MFIYIYGFYVTETTNVLRALLLLQMTLQQPNLYFVYLPTVSVSFEVHLLALVVFKVYYWVKE